MDKILKIQRHEWPFDFNFMVSCTFKIVCFKSKHYTLLLHTVKQKDPMDADCVILINWQKTKQNKIVLIE